MGEVKIDTKWFQDKIADKGTSQRQIAFKMGLDPAAMSLMLNGQRRLEVREAATLAVLIGQPLEEVLARAGVAMPKRKKVPLIGVMNGMLELEKSTDKKSRFVPPPQPESLENLVALRVEDAASPWFGWTYYYEQRESVDADAIGRFCIVKLADGKVQARYVMRGLHKGFSLFVMVDAKDRYEEDQLVSASPVLWIKP